MEKQLSVVLVGAGDRGQTYTDIMRDMPDKYKVVAVAEPLSSRRAYVRDRHGIPEERCFSDWKDMFALGKIADLALICTLDKDHFEPAMAAIALHYDVLLEKPVAPDPVRCEAVAQAAEAAGVKVVVCHVLRYTPLFTAIKRLVEEDRLGEIISVNHEENVGNRHQSHSFVRGNWGNTGRSSNMLLQKSCHDLDILQWLIGKKCRKIQSFGSLRYFTRENAPADAPERCIDGCPHGESCPYNAVRLYLDDKKNAWFREACTRIPSPSDSEVEQALRTTQYGKCVFKCDNDAVDHQTVNMLFDDGVTATFTMCAFNRGGRYIHIMGTKRELRACLTADEEPIRLYDFETKTTSEIPVSGKEGLPSGHGGGDRGIIVSLYDYLTGRYSGSSISGIRISVDNHLLAFAAEESRHKGTVVDVDAYRAGLRIPE
ncbi:MAG: Gfo/Idh/MocA family oxidoreductase [Lachnospiraceae bacterium]|nr:Gfo/Idh/MocA family oxidoreductase [Lachnospiraceae bacterium]